MSRVIKVEDKVYAELDHLKGKGETFSQIIANLLSARLQILEVLNILEGQLKFHEWQQEQLAKARSATPHTSLKER